MHEDARMSNLVQDMIILEAREALEDRPRLFCRRGREIKERDGRAAVHRLTELRIGKRRPSGVLPGSPSHQVSHALGDLVRLMGFTPGHR